MRRSCSVTGTCHAIYQGAEAKQPFARLHSMFTILTIYRFNLHHELGSIGSLTDTIFWTHSEKIRPVFGFHWCLKWLRRFKQLPTLTLGAGHLLSSFFAVPGAACAVPMDVK